MLKSVFTVSIILFSLSACVHTQPQNLSLFDSHIHYNQDVWKSLPAKRAVELLKQNQINKALVSSTPSWGVEYLYQQDPQLIVPVLRPYKDWRHRYYWFRDPQLFDYLQSQLKRLDYQGLGEFHVFGKDMLREPVRQMIKLARQRNLFLHAHTDLVGMKLLLQQAANLNVIWAHGGFDVPESVLADLLEQTPGLFIDLSFREGMLDPQGKLERVWVQLFAQFPERFLVGMDTYRPSRWASLPELSQQARDWLMQLPKDIRQQIAYKNTMRLLDK